MAGSVTLADGGVTCYRRMQPLFIPPATPLIAVVRIEVRNRKFPPALTVSDEIVQLTHGADVRAVQIDFDAPPWAREFYRDLMIDLKQNLPIAVALEMTALVSWCEDDDWIRKMPVADAVPMFFRMGIDPHSPGEAMRDPLCRASIGVSTDEFYTNLPAVRRVYVFGHRLWTEASYRAVLQASKKWFAD